MWCDEDSHDGEVNDQIHVLENKEGLEDSEEDRVETPESFIPVKEMVHEMNRPSLHSMGLPDQGHNKLFVELEELCQSSCGSLSWKETARWIKYEESVEGPDRRWGNPRIPCLNFYSLFQLRKGLEQAVLLFDCQEVDYPSIAEKVVDEMVSKKQIPANLKDSIIKVLLLRHKHARESGSAFRVMSRQHSQSAEEDHGGGRSLSSAFTRRSTRKSLSNIFRKSSSSHIHFNAEANNDGQATNSMAQLDLGNEFEGEEETTTNVQILKKLPSETEAAGVLVGNLDFLTQPVMAFLRLSKSSLFANFVEIPIPVRFMFILLGPYKTDMEYREIGRCIGTLLSEDEFCSLAYELDSRDQLLMGISHFLSSSIVFPPAQWKNNELVPFADLRQRALEIRHRNAIVKGSQEDEQLNKKETITDPVKEETPPPPSRNPLQRHGKPFYGMIQDIKIRYSQYGSDLIDGINIQVFSTCIFIFFANLSPAITFGGLYAQKTQKYIGVGETLLVSSINGMVFALFAAQPILIVGATGPLMIFDMSLYKFCQNMNLDFLSIRVWVGLWILLFGLLVTAFEGVSIVTMFSRFLEEIFSTFVCLIFIYGAFESLYKIFVINPLLPPSDSCFQDSNHSQIVQGLLIDGKLVNGTNIHGADVGEDEVVTNHPNTALLSLCLMLSTFIIAYKLKHLRNSKYFSRGVRRALGDFGVPIAIFLMVLLDYFIKDTHTDKLDMPQGLKPSNAKVRGWLINPFGVVQPLPVWCIFAAAPAALLLYILIFIEENICHLILGKPERCLKKGSGFHLDIVLSCLINTISGFLGAPFMGPACVRTITHMSSLTVTSTNVAPGVAPKIVGCIEQRVSGFVVSLFIGLSALLYMVLNLVPRAVLLGIFLYMGVSATAGIQLIERIVLFFMPVKYFPNVPYVKYVRAYKMHIFTAIQVIVLVILWAVKQSPASLAIPFVFMCLIPLRVYGLPLIFTQEELTALDGVMPSESSQGPDEELDFYETAHDPLYQLDESRPSSHTTKM